MSRRQTCPAELEDFCVSYGAVEAVHSIELQRRRRRDRHGDRPQRRRQDHAAVRRDGPAAFAAARVLLAGERIARPSVEAMVARGVGAGAREARAVRRDVGRGQPAAGRLLALAARPARPAGAHGRRCSRIFPRLQERRAQLAVHALGRRAPDARHRPRADGAPAPADARRAFAGPRAADRARGAAGGVVAAQRMACRCCWSSRTRAPRCRSPTAAMCWRWAPWRSPARPTQLLHDRRIIDTYLGLGGRAEKRRRVWVANAYFSLAARPCRGTPRSRAVASTSGGRAPAPARGPYAKPALRGLRISSIIRRGTRVRHRVAGPHAGTRARQVPRAAYARASQEDRAHRHGVDHQPAFATRRHAAAVDLTSCARLVSFLVAAIPGRDVGGPGPWIIGTRRITSPGGFCVAQAEGQRVHARLRRQLVDEALDREAVRDLARRADVGRPSGAGPSAP